MSNKIFFVKLGFMFMRGCRLFLLTLCCCITVTLAVAQEVSVTEPIVDPVEGQFRLRFDIATLTHSDCSYQTVVLAEALQVASAALFLDLPSKLSNLEAAKRSYIRELVVEIFDGTELFMSMALPVHAPQRLASPLQLELRSHRIRCQPDPSGLISTEIVRVLEHFMVWGGVARVTSKVQNVDGLLPSVVASRLLKRSNVEQIPLNHVSPQREIASPVAYGDVFPSDNGLMGSSSLPPASSTEPDRILPPSLLPSVQERSQRQPLVIAIPDVSSPSVAPVPYEPPTILPPTTTSSAFRLNVSSAVVNPSRISSDVIASAGETAEGYVHVIGYERLPALSPLRVTNFASAQMVIDSQRSYLAVIETNKGRIIAELYNGLAPVTVNNFVFLARYSFYDGVSFHRVVADFLAQTGDPTGTGEGTPGYLFADEIHPQLAHNAAGVLSMANKGTNTNGSQFFMSLQPMPWLDGKHSIFGQVVSGFEVLGRLQPTDSSERLPRFYFDITTTLLEVERQGLVLANRVEFSQNFRAELEALGNSIFTTEPVSYQGQSQPEPTLGDYLYAEFGALPQEGVFFELAGYEMVLVVNAEGKKQLAVFAPDDFIERVYILQQAH